MQFAVPVGGVCHPSPDRAALRWRYERGADPADHSHTAFPKGVLTTTQGEVLAMIHLRAVVRDHEDQRVGPHTLREKNGTLFWLV